MGDAALLELYDREMRIEIEYFDSRREATPEVVRHVSLAGHEGAILYTRCDAARLDQVIREQMDYFDRIGQGCEWKQYAHDNLPDLGKRLLAAGFHEEESEAVLVLDTTRAPADLLKPVTADVRRVDDASHLSDIRAVEEAVWGEDFSELVQTLTAEHRGDPQSLSIYVAYQDGLPVSCAWLRFHCGAHFASLWGGSTLPQYRRRGLYRALVAVRLQEALARGIPFLTVDASPMSAPILVRCGFRQITRCTPYKWRPS